MSNESIKQGAYYLLRGGTLLSEPCEKCGSLQIKFKGNIICMSCQSNRNYQNSSVSIENDKKKISQENIEDVKLQDTITKDNFRSKIEINIVLEEIEVRLLQSIADLSVRLTTDAYSKGNRRVLKNIKESLKILEIIKRLKIIQN